MWERIRDMIFLLISLIGVGIIVWHWPANLLKLLFGKKEMEADTRVRHYIAKLRKDKKF